MMIELYDGDDDLHFTDEEAEELNKEPCNCGQALKLIKENSILKEKVKLAIESDTMYQSANSALFSDVEKTAKENIQLKAKIKVLQIELAHLKAGDSKLNFKRTDK